MGFSNKQINCAIAIAFTISFISLLSLFIIPYQISDLSKESHSFLNKEDVLFLEFCQQYQKNYKNLSEYEKRKQIFINTYQQIEQTNQQLDQNGFEVGINFLSDMTDEERQQYTYGNQALINQENQLEQFHKNLTELTLDIIEQVINQNQSQNEKNTVNSHPLVKQWFKKKIPQSLDWRDYGVVNKIRSQGMCGSCWAFSAVGVIESSFAIKYGKLLELSEQQLLDCSTENYRCNGGFLPQAFKFYTDSFVALRESYSYKGLRGGNQSCQQKGFQVHQSQKKGFFEKFFRPNPVKVMERLQNNQTYLIKVDKHYAVKQNDPQALREALQIGPVGTYINADSTYFLDYKSGIIDNINCSSRTSHAVIIVGYGQEPQKDPKAPPKEFFIIKNSWGTWWGEKGYARISASQQWTWNSGVCGFLQYNYVAIAKQEVINDKLLKNVKQTYQLQ